MKGQGAWTRNRQAGTLLRRSREGRCGVRDAGCRRGPTPRLWGGHQGSPCRHTETNLRLARFFWIFSVSGKKADDTRSTEKIPSPQD